VVAQITNTPWGERHAYVVPLPPPTAGAAGPARHAARFPKTFHVSPFMPMDQEYHWSFTTPGASALVHMANVQDGREVFDATLTLRRRPLDGPNLARCLVAHPWMTAGVLLSIYGHALRLFAKRVPFHAHPARRAPEPAEVEVPRP
jgi:DUF1365 family protein